MVATRSQSKQYRSAGNRVLLTAELLELILPHLDLWTLLHAQRVNRLFKDIIIDSAECQRSLFFLPEKTTPNERFNPKATRFNPLLERHFEPWFNHEWRNNDHYHSPEITAKTFEELMASDSKKDAVLREGASWRRMLVAQPAVHKLRIYQ